MLVFNPDGQNHPPQLYRRGSTIQEASGSLSKDTLLLMGRGGNQADFSDSEGIFQHTVSEGGSILQLTMAVRMSSHLGQGSRASLGALYPEIHHQGQNPFTETDHPGTCRFARSPWPLHLLTHGSHWQSRAAGEGRQTWVPGETFQDSSAI